LVLSCKVTFTAIILFSRTNSRVQQYLKRKDLHEKPTAHISYHQSLQLTRKFLNYASHHTVEEIQSFTAPWVPSPQWVKVENVTIPEKNISSAADALISQLGTQGIEKVGGTKWWQWRDSSQPLRAEWIEMTADFNARNKLGGKSRRVMLYVHGGAYYFCSVDEHRYQIQRHARKLKARVLAR
jgi:acetyl esterase/lipase